LRASVPIVYRPIGIIHTPFRQPEGTPIQPVGGTNAEGWIEIFPEFTEGLSDLDGFSHLILLYHCNQAKPFRLMVAPFLDDGQEHGVFATRSPSRPNPIGLSVVRLTEVAENRLHIRDLDILDRTPLLDLKPYVPSFDIRENTRIGWLTERHADAGEKRDDGRFSA
jgi:tRNA-Thr(GGU) m(6)t(6)A37 methyltransferase TsaA